MRGPGGRFVKTMKVVNVRGGVPRRKKMSEADKKAKRRAYQRVYSKKPKAKAYRKAYRKNYNQRVRTGYKKARAAGLI